MSNWIKVDVNTPHKPAIGSIMDHTGASRAEAFLAWFTLWCWLDMQTADGRLSATRQEIDRVAGLTGTADALVACGWLIFAGSQVSVVNWHEHNGASAKARALAAKRKARERWIDSHDTPPPPPIRPKRIF